MGLPLQLAVSYFLRRFTCSSGCNFSGFELVNFGNLNRFQRLRQLFFMQLLRRRLQLVSVQLLG